MHGRPPAGGSIETGFQYDSPIFIYADIAVTII